MSIITVEKKECRTTIRLFGHTIFRFGEKRRGLYDMKRIIEDYTGVKTNPKKYEIQHGWMLETSNYDLEKDLNLMLVWNKKMKADWEAKSKVPCEITVAPFIIYRRMNKIEKKPDAKGTIAYPIHATHASKPDFDLEKYCRQLKSLPEEFQPVTVSLHHSDIEEYGLDKEYEKYGLKTVCASYGQGNKQFYEAFYDILTAHKYATSNAPGTCSFYAVEAGIPFFILGDMYTIDNSDGRDKNMPRREFCMNEIPSFKEITDLFSNKPYNEITEEQRIKVEEELGLNDGLSKEALTKLLKEKAI